MLPPIQTFNIVPKLPPALEPLREIVYNLWWSWEPSARKLFWHMDPELWERTNHTRCGCSSFRGRLGWKNWRATRVFCAKLAPFTNSSRRT